MSTRNTISKFPAYVAFDGREIGMEGFIMIEPGTTGYMPMHPATSSIEQADRVAMRWGAERTPTKAEREAAVIGSMYGWHVPGADPDNY